ncbi:MAG TPA: M23 family metallopeptidase, partial [Acidimicrobiales bacterium]|nr:M23 family metallopeptidase [Acidimicrobiales bacterium]
PLPPPPGAPARGPAPPPAPPTTVKPGPNAIPPDALAVINSVRRTGGRSTRDLMAALRQLVTVGLTPQEAATIGFGKFPVGGEAAWSDDWMFPRFNPSFHLHEGTDIFAARGTPVRAPADGTVRFTEGGSAGKSAYVTTGDGTYYFMCHLDTFARIPAGSRVKQGDIVGTVGNTGNAQGGAYHLHFEIHPRGGGPVNPKPILDGWLQEALANVPNILAQYQIGVPRALTSAGILRRFDASSGGAGGELFLSLTGSPSGVLRLTELRAARGLGQPSPEVLEEAWRTAQETARSVLSPLTPLLLESVLAPKST